MTSIESLPQSETNLRIYNDENVKKVVDYLLIHKSIHDDTNEHNFEKYINMLNSLKDGSSICIKDPLDKTISLLFELVLEHNFDPWNIDLIHFTRIYMDKISSSVTIDFITAGKLVAMAWEILKLKSDELVLKAQPPSQNIETSQDIIDDGFDYLNMYDAPEDLDFNQMVINSNTPILERTILHPSQRNVSLMELLEAFNQAKAQSELNMKLAELREKRRREQFGNVPEIKVHTEMVEEDIDMTWKRILSFNGKPIPLEKLLFTHDRWEITGIMMALSMLATKKLVELTQKKILHSELLVTNLIAGKDVDVKTLLRELMPSLLKKVES